MIINTKATDVTVTPDIADYLKKRIDSLSKFIDPEDSSVNAQVELARTTRHHEKGDIFKAEITIFSGKRSYRAEAEAVDLFAAIDMMKDQITQELRTDKKRKLHFLRRGGQQVKELLRKFYRR